MALSRSLIANVPYVLSTDPAIDESKSKVDKYRATLDESYLAFLEGSTPARWHLHSLSKAQLLEVWSQTSHIKRCYEALAYGLRSVEGFAVDGQPFRLDTTKSDLGRRLTDECMDVLVRDVTILLEVGNAAIEVSSLRP